MERVGRVASVRRRIGQRAEDVEELDDRSWPSVRDEQWERVRMRGASVDEVHPLAVDRGLELWPLVDAGFSRAPVELVVPVLAELLQIRQLGAVAPSRIVELRGPTGACETLPKIVEHSVGNIDSERRNHGSIVAHGVA